MLTLWVLLLTSAVPAKCTLPNLMMRTEAYPRSAAFSAAATLFDHATLDWKRRHFAEAGRDFLDASEKFSQAGVEGNWKYSMQNAVMAFEAAGKLDEAKAALEAAATRDAAHAQALRAAATALKSREGCQ